MAGLVDATERGLLNGLLGIVPYTTPTNVYLALLKADPTDTGSIADEVSGGAYGRVNIAGAFTQLITETNGISANTAQIAFPTPTTDWGVVTHVAFCSGATPAVADIFMVCELDLTINIITGYVFKFAVGDLKITAD